MLETLSPDLESLVTCDVIAIGFIKIPDESGKDEFLFSVEVNLVSKIEKLFAVDLRHELTFVNASGKAGEIFEVPVSHTDAKVDRIYLLGYGDQTSASFRLAGAALGRKGRGQAKEIALIGPANEVDIRSLAISTQLGSYTWSKKSSDETPEPTFFFATKDDAVIHRADVISEAICRARDLIHTPSNIKTPLWLAQQGQKIAKEQNLKIRILSGKDLSEFGGLLAVGNSSPEPGPRFVEITYEPEDRRVSKNSLIHIVLAGKGITFDTGGISLKRPYDLMTGMKSDMAGAASALATIWALGELQPKIKVTVLMMCAENAISGSAQRPSDVITHYGGTSVEVINTDAEGRLVLADALAYADLHLDPDYLVDIATLTGAATLGLSRHYAAMYTRDFALAKKFCEIGEFTGDRVWHMPLIDDYSGALESDIADFNHTADKEDYSAGSVTAALFLEKFVGERRWVHLDIAGPARSESDTGENPKGGTGFGVRLLIEWITSLS